MCVCVPVKHTPPIGVDDRGCLLLDGMTSNFPILFDLPVSESSNDITSTCSMDNERDRSMGRDRLGA